MKLSTKSRYGVYGCFLLALNYGKKIVSLSEISKIMDVSEAYLEQIFSKLKKAEIVVATRGSQGGYELNKQPQEISIGEIMALLEGNLNLVDCLDGSCEKISTCPTCVIWKRLTDGINQIAYGIKLSDLVDDYVEK